MHIVSSMKAGMWKKIQRYVKQFGAQKLSKRAAQAQNQLDYMYSQGMGTRRNDDMAINFL